MTFGEGVRHMPLEQMGGLRRLAAGLLLAVMLPVGALADAIGTVDTDALVLRKSNSKESKALQTLSRGDTMDILSRAAAGTRFAMANIPAM